MRQGAGMTSWLMLTGTYYYMLVHTASKAAPSLTLEISLINIYLSLLVFPRPDPDFQRYHKKVDARS